MADRKPVVLLTGASRGLGLAILRLLLTGSPPCHASPIPASRVVTISRTIPSDLSSLQSCHPSDLICIQGDVTCASTNEAAVSAAVGKLGGLDSIILNAGVVETQRIESLSPSSLAKMLNINTVSLVTTLSPALSYLRESANPTVVFVSSGAATGNISGWAGYNASKAAMNAIARTLANEEEKIAVFAVRPGVVDTDMQTLLRAKGKDQMKEQEAKRFLDLYQNAKLLKPQQPAWTIAALATRGTRQMPKGKDGKAFGEVGAFLTWNEDVLEGWKNEDAGK
ncbi:related to dehydrogenase [Ustilago bromivora]|uniref:Related to dehydrogenase n=1 Tax=Ustilago bromivora TaxID=307758 RepID=A0A1K0HJ67_9BASI|nr:related to dehydrogenase [Ustilago bromivora]SYW80184.1 related to dehydrogenase [Ustilago bromivora]